MVSLRDFSAVAFGLLPTVFWLLFFLREDRNRPSGWKIFEIFIFGGFLSAIAAIAAESAVKYYFLASLGLALFSPVALFIFAAIEETAKFGSVLILTKRGKRIRQPIDGMIYMITAGLGFAALENIFGLLGSGNALVEIIVMRFIGATLLHALASGFVGFYWMKGKLFRGLAAATLLHTAFNILILGFPLSPFYASLLLLVAAIFLFYDFDIIKAIKTKVIR